MFSFSSYSPLFLLLNIPFPLFMPHPSLSSPFHYLFPLPVCILSLRLSDRWQPLCLSVTIFIIECNFFLTDDCISVCPLSCLSVCLHNSKLIFNLLHHLSQFIPIPASLLSICPWNIFHSSVHFRILLIHSPFIFTPFPYHFSPLSPLLIVSHPSSISLSLHPSLYLPFSSSPSHSYLLFRITPLSPPTPALLLQHNTPAGKSNLKFSKAV